MAAYRVDCLNGINQVTRAESFEAATDEDALVRARQLIVTAGKPRPGSARRIGA
jgi:hypothetical protein